MRCGRQTIRRRFWLPLAIISRARAAGSPPLNQAPKDNRERIRAILAVAHEVVQLGTRRRVDLVDRVSGFRDIGRDDIDTGQRDAGSLSRPLRGVDDRRIRDAEALAVRCAD
jgi:hypothetical protein